MLPPGSRVRRLFISITCSVAIGGALLVGSAQADFRPSAPATDKISKSERDGLVVEMEPTADVLAELAGERRAGQLVVGFAAEHGAGAVERARAKLARKGVDAVVVNDISRSDIGFEAPDNDVTIVTATGPETVARGSKDEVAAAVLDAVERLRAGVGEASKS